MNVVEKYETYKGSGGPSGYRSTQTVDIEMRGYSIDTIVDRAATEWCTPHSAVICLDCV